MQLPAASHHLVTEEVCVLQHLLKRFGLNSIFCIHLLSPLSLQDASFLHWPLLSWLADVAKSNSTGGY